jgi:prophage antirepressor-like protein
MLCRYLLICEVAENKKRNRLQRGWPGSVIKEHGFYKVIWFSTKIHEG